MKNRCKDIFNNIFGGEPQVVCFAPGRVNLIGEHTDYNGGCVFPCAIDLGAYCAAKKRSDGMLRFYSENFSGDGVITASIDELSQTGSWTDYPKGVIRAFRSFGHALPCGADLAFIGDLPDGAGLSSSAALEVLTGTVLRELFSIPVTRQETAVIGQFAENRFIGVRCGIMDQFASAMGKKDNAILLDTDALEFKYAPLPTDKAEIIIVNSGVKHSLASSAYNDRRRECEQALADIGSAVKCPSLCSLTPELFEKHKSSISDKICKKRARHAVYENTRVHAAYDALVGGDIERFGKLMNESHRSLSLDYEVSCSELDFLAKAAQVIEGVYGARMTGGGFGGCTVNLVRKDRADSFTDTITTVYKSQYGIDAAVYRITPEDGAHKI